MKKRIQIAAVAAIMALTGCLGSSPSEQRAAAVSGAPEQVSQFVSTCVPVVLSGANRDQVLAQNGFKKSIMGHNKQLNGAAFLNVPLKDRQYCSLGTSSTTFVRPEFMRVAIGNELERQGLNRTGERVPVKSVTGKIVRYRDVYARGNARVSLGVYAPSNAAPTWSLQRFDGV